MGLCGGAEGGRQARRAGWEAFIQRADGGKAAELVGGDGGAAGGDGRDRSDAAGGVVEGFCVTEPWASVAVTAGAGLTGGGLTGDVSIGVLTGGITNATASNYLALPNVRCVGGSWLTPTDAVRAGDWARITELARATQALRKVA